MPLFYSNDQLQKQLDDTRNTLKSKEEIFSILSRDKEETFTRQAQVECCVLDSSYQIINFEQNTKDLFCIVMLLN